MVKINSPKVRTLKFEEVDYGECFMLPSSKELYMKIYDCNNNFNSVSLSDGCTYYSADTSLCVLVNVEMEVTYA